MNSILLSSTESKIDPNDLPLFTDDVVVFGILFGVLGIVYFLSTQKTWAALFKIIPAVFLCYLIPALLVTFGIISAEESQLDEMAKAYCLPAALILMTISMDVKGLFRLGPKALIMFFTGTVGIILGGPIAIWLMSFMSPETVGGEGFDAAWRGFATIAGSWIGGGANQVALLDVYQYNPKLYGGMVTVDIIVASMSMATLLIGVGMKNKIDKWLKADNRSIDELVEKMERFEKSVVKIPTTVDYIKLGAVTFFGVALSSYLGVLMSDYFTDYYISINSNPDEFILSSKIFWVVLFATFYGFFISLTKARNLEGVGASKFGSVFIYLMVATIGMGMNLNKIFDKPLLMVVGIIWILFHLGLMLLVAKLIKAPYFFLAVGSQSNVGGAATAPVVAAAFHPSLATVGTLLAVLGYFVGTFGGILCAEMMKWIST